VVALAGTWRIGAEDGGRYLRADGAAWVPGTPPANLPMKAALLFPRSAGAFASRVMMGLQFPTAVVADLGTFGDGELAVDFRLIGGETDQYAGLLFGMTDDANHLAFRYNTKDGDAALWRVVDGERERIHHGGIPVTVPLGEWSTLRVRVEGPVLTGWVGDTLALEYTLPSAPAGLVGLWNKADSITDYRNLRVPLSLPGSRARP
jgi:pyruvate,water dikinase